jgi:hypothetical protein
MIKAKYKVMQFASFYESPAALHSTTTFQLDISFDGHCLGCGCGQDHIMSLLKKSRRYAHLSAADRLQSSRFIITGLWCGIVELGIMMDAQVLSSLSNKT